MKMTSQSTPTQSDLIELGQALSDSIEAGKEWRTLYSDYNTMSRMLEVPASHLQGYSDSALRVELARVINEEAFAADQVTWMRKRNLESHSTSAWEKRFNSEMAQLGTIREAIISRLEDEG